MTERFQIDVSVIIPTYNRKDSLLRTLESLARQTYPADRFEVIVVDDGSNDGTGVIAKRTFPFFLRYVYQNNQGEIVARNTGAEQSAGGILVFLDDDIEVNPNYLEALTAVHMTRTRSVVLGTLIELQGAPTVEERKTSGQSSSYPAVEAVTFIECMSGIVSVSREGFFEIGAMQPLLNSGGRNIWGGIDFGYRAYTHEFRFWRARNAVALHHDDALVSLQARSRRNYRISYAVHYLFAKYPVLQDQIPMFRDKGPIAFGQDPPLLILRKLARQIISSRPAMAAMEWGAPLLERHAPESTALRLLYRWIISGYIYRGYREGLREVVLVGSA